VASCDASSPRRRDRRLRRRVRRVLGAFSAVHLADRSLVLRLLAWRRAPFTRLALQILRRLAPAEVACSVARTASVGDSAACHSYVRADLLAVCTLDSRCRDRRHAASRAPSSICSPRCMALLPARCSGAGELRRRSLRDPAPFVWAAAVAIFGVLTCSASRAASLDAAAAASFCASRS